MLASVLRYVELVVFVLIALATILRWVRHRGAAEGWLAATFGLLGGLSALGSLLPDKPDDVLPTAVVKVFVVALVLFPYCLYRFMASFEQPPRTIRLITLGLVGGVIVATALLPRFPQPGEPRSAVFWLYVLLFIAEWVFLCGLVCVRLWRAGRDLPTVASRRTRLLAAGAGVMAADVVLSSLGSTSSKPTVTTVVVELVAILSVALFFTGFAPPLILLKIWRRADETAFQDAMVALVQATTPDRVVDGLMPHIARLVGAKGIELRDDAGALLGRTGETPPDDADRLSLALPAGRLDVWSTPYTPFFGREELSVLRSLGSLLHLTLERTTAHERELQAGGDEFVLLCSGLADSAEALVIADRLQGMISRPMTIRGAELIVTASTGISLASGGGTQPGSLLRDADAAMYRAKELGRSRSVLFADTMRTQVIGRLDTEMELRRAVALDQLCLHYQPIMNLDTETVTGFEALVRWQHPTRGLVPPDEFIGIAEETGLIVPLGEWVLERACEQLLAWQGRTPECGKLGMAVNLSAVQIAQPGFADRVADILARVGVEPGSLELEITETVLMRDAQATLMLLRSLKEQGIRLSIDDFGTGYSSLSYLKRFPVDTLKIDRAFVAGLGRDPDDSAIVQAIQALAATLGMGTVAEGLESAEQLDVLVRLGCDKAQGYYFSRPSPAHDMTSLLDRLLPVSAAPVRAAAAAAYTQAGAELAGARSVRSA